MNIRIGNIELLENEIVRWCENDYYDCEKNNKRLLEKGFTRNAEGGWDKDNIHIHPSCTEKPKVVYTVADIEWNSAHDEYNIVSCGKRLLELDENDLSDFKSIIDLMEKKNKREQNEKKEN